MGIRSVHGALPLVGLLSLVMTILLPPISCDDMPFPSTPLPNTTDSYNLTSKWSIYRKESINDGAIPTLSKATGNTLRTVNDVKDQTEVVSDDFDGKDLIDPDLNHKLFHNLSDFVEESNDFVSMNNVTISPTVVGITVGGKTDIQKKKQELHPHHTTAPHTFQKPHHISNIFQGLPKENHTVPELESVTTNMLELPRQQADNKTVCEVTPTSSEVYKTIKHLVGRGTKLVEYDINFPEYETNPLMVNMSNRFMSKRLARAFTNHGRTLLALSFNYDVLSLTLLSFGVEYVNVDLIDEPQGCFGSFTADQKLAKVMQVLMSDFSENLEDELWVDYVCHQMVENISNVADFQYRCYYRAENGERKYMAKSPGIVWLSFFFVLINVLKVVLFLTGPVVLYSSLKKVNYTVKLQNPEEKNIIKTKDEIFWKSLSGYVGKVKHFPRFRKTLDELPTEKPQTVTFNELLIEVDYRLLMNEKFVPVGLFRFFYTMIIFCGIRRWQPFLSCCKQNIWGSWSPRFLWMKLFKKPTPETFLTWEHLFMILGGILLLVMLPIPYYVRIWIYYLYEEADVIARRDAVRDLQLQYPLQNHLLYIFHPRHGLMIAIYSTYCISFIVLAAFRSFNVKIFEPIAIGAIRDMRNMNRKHCFSLIASHIVLPFEKFGLCGGLLVGVLYWPIALPICLLVTIIYSLPTVYLLGRFLIYKKPGFLHKCPGVTSKSYQQDRDSTEGPLLSDGTEDIKGCLLLDNISPPTNQDTYYTYQGWDKRQGSHSNAGPIRNSIFRIIVGIFCCLLMISVLILVTDVLGFLIEIFVFTLMGAIVNASSASKYLMLVFWILVYSTTCFNNVYKKYMVLNERIFEIVKDKLKERVNDVTMLRADLQCNTGFKYFERKEIEAMQSQINKAMKSNPFQSMENIPLKAHYATALKDEALKFKRDRLSWSVNSLVLFVDQYDMPHIPRQLFHKICELQGPGCPGPVHHGLIEAFKHLSYMITFLLFVMVTVMVFGEAYQLSTTNQMLVTLAGGFIPTFGKAVFTNKLSSMDLQSISFVEKLKQVIYNFNQTWPVIDLPFSIKDEAKDEFSTRGGSKSSRHSISTQTNNSLFSQVSPHAAIALAENFTIDVEGMDKADMYPDIPLIDGVMESSELTMGITTKVLPTIPEEAVLPEMQEIVTSPFLALGKHGFWIDDQNACPWTRYAHNVDLVYHGGTERFKINSQDITNNNNIETMHLDESFVYHRVPSQVSDV